MLAVAARHHPGGQVVLAAGREGQHLDELVARLARQPHDRVIRLHGHRLAFHLDGRHLPLVLLVVEDFRVRHVERRVDRGLDGEDVLGVPDVAPERGRHLVQGREQAGEHVGQRGDDRVAGIREVEGDLAVVGIDDDLHRVPDVVDAAGGRRVRIARTRGVGVPDPAQSPVGHDQVRVRVVGEERCDRGHPLTNLPVEHHASLGADVVAQQDLQRAESKAEQQLSPEALDRHATLTRIGRKDVVVALRVVELLGLRANEDIVVRPFPVVERRLVQREVHGRFGRQVLDEQDGQPLLRDLVHGPQRHAVAMGEDEPLVDPVPARQAVGVQLAGRQHYLAKLPVDLIAIVVDRHEVVVRPDLLDLPERVEQWLVIPEPHVAQRARVAVDIGPREEGVAGELPPFDTVQPERPPRRGDVVDDVRRLAHELVWSDREALNGRRGQLAAQRHHEIGNRGKNQGPRPSRETVQDGQHRSQRADGGQHVEGRDPDVDVRVRRAVDDARRGDEEMGDAEPGPDREDDEQQRREQRQMPAGSGRHAEPPPRIEAQGPGQHVQRSGPDDGEHQDDEGDRAQMVEGRQHEDVEGDIPRQDGVHLAKRPTGAQQQPGQPLARCGQAEEEADADPNHRGHRPELTALEHDRPHLDGRGTEYQVRLRHCLKGVPEARREDQRGRQAKRDPDDDLRAHPIEEHLAVSHLEEPQPVGVHLDGPREPDEDGHGGEQNQA